MNKGSQLNKESGVSLSKGSQLYKESGDTIEQEDLFEQGVRGLK